MDVVTIINCFLLLLVIFIAVDTIAYMVYGFNAEKIHSSYKYDIFLPENIPVSIKQYKNIVRGKKICQKSSIVICCLCRNIERCFSKSKARLEGVGCLFSEYKIILFENDSKDQSRSLLQQWDIDNPNVHLLNCSDIGLPNCQLDIKHGYTISHNDRIKNMCFYRNRYLDYVKKNYAHYNFLMVYDFDLEGGFLKSGIYDSLGREEYWDGIFANGRTPLPPFGIGSTMYDGLAFLKDEKCVKDSTLKRFWHLCLLNGRIGDPLIPVLSAFNGMAIYRIPSILRSSYAVLDPPLACEHVGLHNDMSKKGFGTFYINPSMLLYAGLQGPQNKFSTCWKLMDSP